MKNLADTIKHTLFSFSLLLAVASNADRIGDIEFSVEQPQVPLTATLTSVTVIEDKNATYKPLKFSDEKGNVRLKLSKYGNLEYVATSGVVYGVLVIDSNLRSHLLAAASNDFLKKCPITITVDRASVLVKKFAFECDPFLSEGALSKDQELVMTLPGTDVVLSIKGASEVLSYNIVQAGLNQKNGIGMLTAGQAFKVVLESRQGGYNEGSPYLGLIKNEEFMKFSYLSTEESNWLGKVILASSKQCPTRIMMNRKDFKILKVNSVCDPLAAVPVEENKG